MAKTILEMANISKEFPGVKALDDVTFKVDFPAPFSPTRNRI